MFVGKITIIKLRKPSRTTLNEELQWFGNSLGLFNLRDRDKSCFRVFLELLKAAKMHHPLSSDDIANNLNLSRGTVIHHINNLVERGMVSQIRKKYVLRQPTLKELIADLKRDAEQSYKELETAADKIDELLGL
ncbi:winged helix-turn-helix transcriptional regulator [Candidatus Woesearchaeota archaeon]|nr:winged helix-turn-helix transcriptional regulator [Candidatus Woesearchaeota archaeon]